MRPYTIDIPIFSHSLAGKKLIIKNIFQICASHNSAHGASKPLPMHNLCTIGKYVHTCTHNGFNNRAETVYYI